MPSHAMTTSARTVSPGFPVVGLFEVDGRAVVVLLDAGAFAIGQHRVTAESFQHGFVKHDVQAATMDTDFRKGIAGKFPPILAIDQLAETIEECALAIFDAGLEQGVAQRRAW